METTTELDISNFVKFKIYREVSYIKIETNKTSWSTIDSIIFDKQNENNINNNIKQLKWRKQQHDILNYSESTNTKNQITSNFVCTIFAIMNVYNFLQILTF